MSARERREPERVRERKETSARENEWRREAEIGKERAKEGLRKREHEEEIEGSSRE